MDYFNSTAVMKERNSITTYLLFPSRVEKSCTLYDSEQIYFLYRSKKNVESHSYENQSFVLLCIDERSFMIIRMIEV